jgi:hypothetical protein
MHPDRAASQVMFLLQNPVIYASVVGTNVIDLYFGRVETVYFSYYYPFEMSEKISSAISGS